MTSPLTEDKPLPDDRELLYTTRETLRAIRIAAAKTVELRARITALRKNIVVCRELVK